MSDKDGGTAFPNPWDGSGMTLRDYFAAAAIAPIMNALMDEVCADEIENVAGQLALKAYELADAMIKERSK